MSAAKEVLEQRLAAAKKLMGWALKSEDAKRINAMLDLTRSEPGIPILSDHLDSDPWLFNCPNGTLDLRGGTLREHRREDLITKLCPTPYDPDAKCPVFEKFIDAIFDQDEELILFVHRLLGRCVSGDVSEHLLPIFWGGGENGKSTLVEALLYVMGKDYAMKANQDLLMQPKGERHATERAQLFGMRLVVASETSEGGQLNEALVKDLTGGERIRARRMRENFWEFNPTHKLLFITNHKPVIRGSDRGIWRRLRLVPFTVSFWNPEDPANAGKDLPPDKKQDKKLGDKLKAEAPGILAWLVRGCRGWLRDGLPLPDKVKVATEDYRAGEDRLQHFIEERCVVGDPANFRVRRGNLYRAYQRWCECAGEDPLKDTPFGEAMVARGFERFKSNGVWYKGLAIRPVSFDGEE
jgi:putative DNA primase/helicase